VSLASATGYEVVRRNFLYASEGTAFDRAQFQLPGWPKLQPDAAIGAVRGREQWPRDSRYKE
jgi:hypothetical protein